MGHPLMETTGYYLMGVEAMAELLYQSRTEDLPAQLTSKRTWHKLLGRIIILISTVSST
jgi:hypothetical protein